MRWFGRQNQEQPGNNAVPSQEELRKRALEQCDNVSILAHALDFQVHLHVAAPREAAWYAAVTVSKNDVSGGFARHFIYRVQNGAVTLEVMPKPRSLAGDTLPDIERYLRRKKESLARQQKENDLNRAQYKKVVSFVARLGATGLRVFPRYDTEVASISVSDPNGGPQVLVLSVPLVRGHSCYARGVVTQNWKYDGKELPWESLDEFMDGVNSCVLQYAQQRIRRLQQSRKLSSSRSV